MYTDMLCLNGEWDFMPVYGVRSCHHPEYYLDAADEAGILIVDETAIYGSAKSMPADDPIYLDMCKKHVERLVKRDRNHPSVVVWSLQNEMRWVDGRDGYKLHIPELMQIFRELGSTRSILLEV